MVRTVHAASLRDVGRNWIGGRAGGKECNTALRHGSYGRRSAPRVPALGFRPNGSPTPVRGNLELAALTATAPTGC